MDYMAVYLLQVSGKESTHGETDCDYLWQEPIEEGTYIQYNWKRFEEIWDKLKAGDKVIFYCASNVKPHPKQIKFVGEVEEVVCEEDRAFMKLNIDRLHGIVPYDIILREVDTENLSKGMKGCGRHGFNIGKVEMSDLERVKELSEEGEHIQIGVRADKEIEIQRYFEANPQAIEEGFRLIDERDDVLPLGAGEPDLICEDRNDNFVVIELKAGVAGYDALGQVISYKSAVKKKTGVKVRGILIANDFDSKISYAPELKDSDDFNLVEFMRYSIQTIVEPFRRNNSSNDLNNIEQGC